MSRPHVDLKDDGTIDFKHFDMLSCPLMHFFKRILMLTSLALAPGASAQLSNGLYAVFHSNFGSMTVLLHEAESPLTVANFIGLAEGTKTWIEESSGLPSTRPYFDGQVVNRVADLLNGVGTNRVRIIQSGSQNGSNQNGGPGYVFLDEIPNSFTHTTGTLSMANSGQNANGSQFFFSMGDLAELDERHTLFARVYAGLDVLETIAALPLTNGKPVPDVVWSQIEILRIGTNAAAFDARDAGLPEVAGVALDIGTHSTSNLVLTLPTNQYSTLHISETPDLETWAPVYSHLHLDNAPSPLFVTHLTSTTKQFFAAARVDYPPPLMTPFDIEEGRIIGIDSAQSLAFNAKFNAATGTIQFIVGSSLFSGRLDSWSWDPRPYSGKQFSTFTVPGIFPDSLLLDLNFLTATSGVFRGEYFSTGVKFSNSSGTFTYTPPP